MPPTGLEPACWVTAQALNLPCIPIPPQGLFNSMELYQFANGFVKQNYNLSDHLLSSWHLCIFAPLR